MVFVKKTVVGGTELESVTSTMSTSESLLENPAKHGKKGEDTERLHQCLHQISESIERDELETLVESIADSLGQDAFGRLADTLIQRAKRD